MRGGFTLVEIVVALVVLEVGLLGVVGSLILGATFLAEANELEHVAARMEWVYDSLVAVRVPVGGEQRLGQGTLQWLVDGGGAMTFEYHGDDGRLVVRAHGLHAGVPFALGPEA